MKTTLAAMVLTIAAAAPTAHATDIGVSIGISQPGVYGRIDIGRFPQPAIIVPQPVIIAPRPVVVAPQPVYMWVPREHRRNWGKHCRKYDACGVPVYFVRHDWYHQQVYYGGDPRRSNWDDDHDDRKHRGKGKDRD
jgi:hypothetical protein